MASGDTIDHVTQNFMVPLLGNHGTTIVWSETSNYVTIDPLTGEIEITRPETVALTMATINVTVSKGSVSDGKGYMIYIPKMEPGNNTYEKTCIVQNAQGIPLSSVSVKVLAADDSFEQTEFTDTQGKTIFYLTNGEYTINVTLDGYEPLRDTFVITGANNSESFTLTAISHEHTIKVSDSKNQPLEGALVKLDSTTLNVHESLTTDSEGKAVFLLANGNYGVSVSKAGYASDANGGITVHNTDGTHLFSLLNTANHTGGGGNSTVKEPLKKNPLSQQPETGKDSAVQEVARVEIRQDLVKKTGDKVTADLSKLDLTKELSGLENKEDIKDNLNPELKPVVKVESKITLNIPIDNNAKEFEVVLPKLEKVFERVDRVRIESDIASFEIKENTFGELGNDGIKLSATKLDKASLPENLRERIPEGVNEVIDLNAYVKEQKVSNFNIPIEVFIPYALKEGDDPEKVSVYLLNDIGEIEKVAGVYDAVTGKITVKRKHFSKYYISVSNDTFSDIQNSWAKHPIEVLAGKGIITGKSSGVYDLKGMTTRAELVSLIARMLSLKPEEDQDVFRDVLAEAWYAESIKAMYQTGIIKGNPDMTFAPEKMVTREEAAVILSNTLNYLELNQVDNNTDGLFSDHEHISSWAKESVTHVYNWELMNGYPAGDFRPSSNLNRAEMAQIIYKLFNLYNY